MAGIKQRREIADYINITPRTDKETITFMGLGFKTLNENPGAQTSSKRYINDKSASKSITGYDSSFPFELDQIRSEAAVEYIIGIGEKRLTGADAETEYYRVDLDKKIAGAGENTYYARKFKVAVEVSALDDSEGEMTGSGNLLPIGDPVEGYAVINAGTITFTAGTYAAGGPTEE